MTATSDDFQMFFLEYFRETVDSEVLKSIDWDAWFHKPGFPPVLPKYDNSLGKQCSALKDRWIGSVECSYHSSKDLETFSVAQIIELLAQLLLVVS